MTVTILQGDCRERLREMAAGSVHATITSPPYWGLRDYGLPPSTWGGRDGCPHEWGEPVKRMLHTGSSASDKAHSVRGAFHGDQSTTDQFCRLCGCWKGALGLEPTPRLFVSHLVEVFREVKRVLRDDGTVFLNLGSSYASSSFDESSLNEYNLREDLTDEEKRNVCMEMFGVRFNGDQAQGQGPMRQMLQQEIYSNEDGCRSTIQGKAVSRELSETQGETANSREGQASSVEMGSDRAVGREMCLLRGNGPRVSDGTSYQQRRSRTSKGNRNQQRAHELGQGVQRHPQSGIPQGQICCDVLQLQLFTRLVGILSTHTYKRHEIPDSARFAFTQRGPRFKPKDLIPIPWMVAMALQQDGWWLRSSIIWAKGLSFCPTYSGSVMPESVTDRPTSAYEHVFLLSKQKRYYYDAESVREPLQQSTLERGYSASYFRNDSPKMQEAPGDVRAKDNWRANAYIPAGRNLRNVWAINPAGFPGSHFATFPPKLIEPMIKAGTSERGCCPECGAGWVRVTHRDTDYIGATGGFGDHNAKWKTQDVQSSGFRIQRNLNVLRAQGRNHDNPFPNRITLGWTPTCECQFYKLRDDLDDATRMMVLERLNVP